MTTAPSPNRSSGNDSARPVSKFEFNLLRILRFMMGHAPAEHGLQQLRLASTRPDCLSANAVALVKDTLAKATVLFLVRKGGWRNDRYLRQGAPVQGRVWERIPLDERTLSFSPPVLEFLVWATSEKVSDTKTAWDAVPAALTPADELFFWLAFDAVRTDPDLTATLRGKDAFGLNPLCWISSPGDMVEGEAATPPDFAPLFEGQRAVFFECLQTHLTERWVRSELQKRQIGDWRRMRMQGRAEAAMFQLFLAAAEDAKRLDLTRFVLRTNAAILSAEVGPEFWTGGLQGTGPQRLAERLETQRAALAVPRQMETLERWQERALGVGFFDDDYQASQLWKAEWEAVGGDRIAERARAVVERLEPLRAGPTGSARAGAPRPEGESAES